LIKHIVFWGLCAILVFVPLPIGSVEEWAVFVFEAATLGLFLLYLGGNMAANRRLGQRGSVRPAPQTGRLSDEAPDWDRARDWGHGGIHDAGMGAEGVPPRIPLAIKVLLAVFLVVSLLQVVPLPAVIVKLISPRAHDIFLGLSRDGITAPSAWQTLSLAPSATLAELVLILCYGVFGFLVLRSVRSRRQVEIFVLVILASALFQAFYGMAEMFSGHEMIFGRVKRFGSGSVTGTYVNRNHFAGFLEMVFPLSLGYLLVKARYFAMEKGLSLRRRILWFSQESLQWTLLLGLVPVFIGVGLVFSKSRSGILILVVTVVLAAAATASWREFSEGNGEREGEWPGGEGERGRGGGQGSRRRFGRIIRLVFTVVLAAAVWLGVGPIIERFSEVDISHEARRLFYENTVRMIGDFPLAGAGKGTYVNAYAMYETVDDRLRLSFAHNDYLEFAAENGVLAGGALALAGIGLAVWLAAMWRRRRSGFAKGIGLGALLGITAILIHGFTDFNLQIPANAVYFTALAMLGVIVVGSPKKGDTSKESQEGGHVPGVHVPEDVAEDSLGEYVVEDDHEDLGEWRMSTARTEQEGGHVPEVRRGADSEERPSEVRRSGSEPRFWEISKTSLKKKRDIHNTFISPFQLLFAGLLAVVLFIPAYHDFLGFRYLGEYHRVRGEARSVESAFPALEARLEQAASSSPRAVFRVELARLYTEMARVANDSGREEDRESLCDKAVASYDKAIAANPIDAFTHYETGMVYLLYNFPLMTYADRAKAYFRKAVELKPADEFINLNVIFLYFSWWPALEDAEKAYAAGLFRAMTGRDPGFAAKLEARWKQSKQSVDALAAILAEIQ